MAMNTANLENCKKLYELSKWTRDCWWYENKPVYIDSDFIRQKLSADLPAYDSGYMLRKLPEGISTSTASLELKVRGGTWIARYGNKSVGGAADTPEDALALLCIKLIEEKVLKP